MCHNVGCVGWDFAYVFGKSTQDFIYLPLFGLENGIFVVCMLFLA